MSKRILDLSIKQGGEFLKREQPPTITIVVDPETLGYGIGKDEASRNLVRAIHHKIGHSCESFVQAIHGVCDRAEQNGYVSHRPTGTGGTFVLEKKPG